MTTCADRARHRTVVMVVHAGPVAGVAVPAGRAPHI